MKSPTPFRDLFNNAIFRLFLLFVLAFNLFPGFFSTAASEPVDTDTRTAAEIIQERGNTPKTAYISLFPAQKTSRSVDNGGFYVYGSTSDNCDRIVVRSDNDSAGIHDLHQLTKYEYGDVTFKYGMKEEWGNLGIGINTVTFTAYCDGGQVKTVTRDYTFPADLYIPAKTTYVPSNTSYYTNTSGNKVPSPRYSVGIPVGASARCKDGTYSFSQSRRGTCSHHGGVSIWL